MNLDKQLDAFDEHATNAYRAVLDYLLMNHREIILEAQTRLIIGDKEFPDAPMFSQSFDHYGNLLEELADAVNYMVGYVYAYNAQNGMSSKDAAAETSATD